MKLANTNLVIEKQSFSLSFFHMLLSPLLNSETGNKKELMDSSEKVKILRVANTFS